MRKNYPAARSLFRFRWRSERRRLEPRIPNKRRSERLSYNEFGDRNYVTQFNRITFDPLVMGGRACIRGLRITVALVVNLVANGMTAAQIIEEYPYLEEEDVRQSLQYAAWLADESVQILEPSAA
jgi:uncharacterized protein (DUF433 family)